MTYSITLQDFPEIPNDARAKAENQYRRALEKALGGPDEIPRLATRQRKQQQSVGQGGGGPAGRDPHRLSHHSKFRIFGLSALFVGHHVDNFAYEPQKPRQH